MYRFQDIVDYWSNFHCQQRGVPIFNAFVWNKPLTGDYEICPQQTRNIALLCAQEVFTTP